MLGRNCRFLQHPSGQLQRGEPRQFTAPDAVRHFHKSLLQDKECQASLINYRKGGDAFINLVTVIPISSPEDERDSESGEITHCVGFQVDLAEQPNAIMEKLRDGSYIVNYSSVGVAGLTGPGFSLLPGMPGSSMGRERRAKGVSAEMIDILRDARAYSGTRPGQAGDVGIKGARDSDRAELHSLLLENTDGMDKNPPFSVALSSPAIFRLYPRRFAQRFPSLCRARHHARIGLRPLRLDWKVDRRLMSPR